MLIWYNNSSKLEEDARSIIYKAMESVEGKEVAGDNECVLIIQTDGTVAGTCIKIVTRRMNLLALYDGEKFVGTDGQALMMVELNKQ